MERKIIEDISCVIIAGGKSSRMDQDKALMRFRNYDSMAKYQYKKFQKIFKKVYISSKTNKFDFLDSNNLILDQNSIFSPMVALASILKNINTPNVFIVSVDMPLISNDTIYSLINSSKILNSEITVAKEKNHKRHNLCGVFNRSIYPKVHKLINKDIHKIDILINSCDYKEVLCEESSEFVNINTKKDYMRVNY